MTMRTQTALCPLCHVMLRFRCFCLVAICVERAALGGSCLLSCQEAEGWVRGQGVLQDPVSMLFLVLGSDLHADLCSESA